MRRTRIALQPLAKFTRQTFSGWTGWMLRMLVTVGLLSLMGSKIDGRLVAAELRDANPAWILGGLACAYGAWIVNTCKWQRLLAACGLRHGVAELFHLNLASIFYGITLPGQATGDILKAIRLAGRVDRRTAVYLSVIMDRVTGLVGLFILGALAIVLDRPRGLADWSGTVHLGVLVVFGLATAASLLVALAFRHGGEGRGGAWIKWLPRAHAAALRNLLSVRRVGQAILLGALFQCLAAAVNWLFARAIGIDVSPAAIAWVFAAVSLVQFLPISIGGFGPREATYAGLLALYGVPPAEALALSLLMFAQYALLGVTGGLTELSGAWKLRRRSGTAESGL